ncbi:MAG: glyoxalase/bleomycin resistance/dioxygenase family protein [Pseudohongiella sp.]|nr:glyoxalase/bleomycin resistance/dioxygenase family protein [Pseudohongiella sp.]
MSGPAQTGAVIYAKNLRAMTDFYGELLSGSVIHESNDFTVLQLGDFQLVIHAMPPHIASMVEISTPPELREDTAIKLFFTVSSFEWATEVVNRLGGIMQSQRWHGTGFAAGNAADCEGNVLQLRVFKD